MKKLGVTWLTLVWLAVVSVFGQQGPEPETELRGLENEFLLRVWETSEGLFPTVVRSVAQARDGYVWLASHEGVVRFDGARAITFSGKNTVGLPTPMQAFLVHGDRAGRLWVVTMQGRLFSLTRGVWREYKASNGWPGLAAQSISETSNGDLIFAGAQKLLRLDGEKVSSIRLPSDVARSDAPIRAFVDSSDHVWIYNRAGLWRQDHSKWKPIHQMLDPNAAVLGGAPSKDGGAWIASNRAVYKFDGDRTVLALPLRALSNDEDVQLLEDFRHNLWISGSSCGLRVRMADGRVLVAGTGGNESQLAPILQLFEDREHNVLLATRGAGLARLKPRVFDSFLGNTGALTGTMINSVCEESDGNVLIATEGRGLHRVTPSSSGGFSLSPKGLLGPRDRVTSLLKLSDGGVLAAASGVGLFRIGSNAAEQVDVSLPTNANVRVMFEDSQRRLWLGHDGGVILGSNGSFQTISPGKSGSLKGVRGIAEDSKGVVWMVGTEGLARVEQLKLIRVAIPKVSPKTQLLALYIDPEDALWLGAENIGLVRYKDGDAFVYTHVHGLPIKSIGAILPEQSHLWLTGEKGLARVSCKSLKDVASGNAGYLEALLLNRGDGLASDAFRRACQPTAFRASDGRLWFATHKGAVSLEPNRIVSPAYEPPAIIEEVRAEMTLFHITGNGQSPIEIAPDFRRMNVRCTTPTLNKPDYYRFRYQMEGPTGVWSNFGTERLVHFQDLMPGNYRYTVWAVANNGRLVEPPASIRLKVLPHFWQTMWFRVLALIGLLASSGGTAWRIQQYRIAQRDEKLSQQEARTRLEEQLHQAQRLEAIGRLAGGIAHDFNNLLTVIIGNSQILQKLHQTDSTTKASLGEVLQAGWRARDLVSQILLFSRQDPIKRSIIDIVPCLRDACRLLRCGIPATTDVVVEIPDSLPSVLADTSQIHRIVMNLGTNAVHAIGSQGGRIVLRAEDFVADKNYTQQYPEVAPGHYVRITVEDNGVGMDDATMSRIFTPFFTTKDVGKGTGLGLAVVHGIVEAHDGVVAVRSRPNSGSVFSVYLPVTLDSAPTPDEKLRSIQRGRGESVLLVDDEEAVLMVSQKILEKLGYKVVTESDPQKAVTEFARDVNRYDLVITDFAMPALSGVEMARQMWNLRKDLPIVLYTGYGGSIGSEEAVKLGFVTLLTKPFEEDQLAEAVAAAASKTLTR